MNSSTPVPIRVAALYKFCRLDAPAELKRPLAAFCCASDIRGTLLLAAEGINGTVAGEASAIDALVAHLQSIPAIGSLEVKYSDATAMPFHRMKVRLKREIAIFCMMTPRMGSFNISLSITRCPLSVLYQALAPKKPSAQSIATNHQ